MWQNHKMTRNPRLCQPMPKKILQEGESAGKIYPVATELVLLRVSCAGGIIKEILHLANEQPICLPHLEDSYTCAKPETPGSSAQQVQAAKGQVGKQIFC